MSKQITAAPTQVRRPWRSTLRTVVQAIVAFGPMAPLIYSAATHNSPEAATGAVALALAIAGGVTRVMALPQVETFLRTYVPWLAANPPA